MFITLIILAFVCVSLIFIKDKKPKGLPPGPWGLPVIGDISTGGLITVDKLKEMKETYGDVFSLRIGSLFFVFIADFETMNNIFNHPDCQDRPQFYAIKLAQYFKNIGLVESDGEEWKANRYYAMKLLGHLGMGKSRLQDSILNEAKEITTYLQSLEGKPTELGYEMNVATLNVIWQLVASKRYEIEDKSMVFMANMINDALDIIQGPCAIISAFPWLVKVCPKYVLDKFFQLDELREHRDKVHGYMKVVIEEHLKKHDPEYPVNFIDYYLLEIEKEKDNPLTTFKDDHLDLLVTITDLFIAGSESTSSTMRWMVLLFAAYPEVQKKCQDLIDEVVPRSRQPCLEDRESLTYIGAVILEVMRYSSFSPQGAPHLAKEDIEIGGYHVPKGSIIAAASVLCHYNPEYFEKPDEFYPEHFIGENGELLSKKRGYCPFSLGRRRCLGENLARVEIFIFASSITQRLTVTPHPDHPLDLSFDQSRPFFNFTKPFKVTFHKRT